MRPLRSGSGEHVLGARRDSTSFQLEAEVPEVNAATRSGKTIKLLRAGGGSTVHRSEPLVPQNLKLPC